VKKRSLFYMGQWLVDSSLLTATCHRYEIDLEKNGSPHKTNCEWLSDAEHKRRHLTGEMSGPAGGPEV
jgi:hypothetical protein